MTELQFLFQDPKAVCSVLDNIQDEMFIYDLNARLLYVNKAGEKSEGYTLEEKKGTTLFESYDFEDDLRPDRSPAYIALTERKDVENMLCIYHSGEVLLKKNISAHMIYKDDEAVAVLVVQRDIHDIYDLLDENVYLQNQLAAHRIDSIIQGHNPFSDIPAFGDSMKHCISLSKKAAVTDSPVMLCGKPGTGRSNIARAIHDSGSRAGKPFISLNCSHFSGEVLDGILFGTVNSNRKQKNVKGLLERAAGGTLYLEDISSLPKVVQTRLLRFMEYGGKFVPLGSMEELSVDVRIICSCQQSALELIKNNLLQSRLFYCLSVIYIQVPSLKERREEIPLLAEYYVRLYNKQLQKNVTGIEPDVLSFFRVFEWSDNLLQFRRCIEAAVNLANNDKNISMEDLPATMLYSNGGSNTGSAQFADTADNIKKIIPEITYDPAYAAKQRKMIIENDRIEEKNR